MYGFNRLMSYADDQILHPLADLEVNIKAIVFYDEMRSKILL